MKDSRAISLSLTPHCISLTKKSHSRRTQLFNLTNQSQHIITCYQLTPPACHLQEYEILKNLKKFGDKEGSPYQTLECVWGGGGRFTICLHITLADFFLGRVGSLLHLSLVFLAQLLAVTLGVPASRGPIANPHSVFWIRYFYASRIRIYHNLFTVRTLPYRTFSCW